MKIEKKFIKSKYSLKILNNQDNNVQNKKEVEITKKFEKKNRYKVNNSFKFLKLYIIHNFKKI